MKLIWSSTRHGFKLSSNSQVNSNGFKTLVKHSVMQLFTVHTLTCCTHIFLHTARSLRTSAHSPACTHTHGSRSWKRCLLHAHVVSLHVAFSIFMSHLSPPAVLARSLRDQPHRRSRPHCLAELSRPKSAGQAHFRTSDEQFGYLAKSVLNPGLWTQRVRQDHFCGHPSTIRITVSPTCRKPHERALDCSVFPQCLNPVFCTFSWWFCSSETKQRKHAIGKRLQDRGEREGSVISVAESKSMNSRWNGIRSHSHRLTENYILMHEISENTWNEELNKLFLAKIQFRENYSRHGDPKFGTKKFRIRVIRVATSAWIWKTTVIGSQSMERSSSAWENTFVWRIEDEEPSSPGLLRKRLPRIWRNAKTLLSRGKYWKNKDWDNFLRSVIRITYSASIERSSTKIARMIIMTVPTFLIKLLLPRVQESLVAKLECCEIHEMVWVLLETFLIDNMLDEIMMKYTMIQEIWQRHWRFWEQKELWKVRAKNHCNQYQNLSFR